LGVYLYIDETSILFDGPLDQISRSLNREGNATRFESYSQGGKKWVLVEVGVVQGDEVHVVEHLSSLSLSLCVCVRERERARSFTMVL
jgi:hypothetical protein